MSGIKFFDKSYIDLDNNNTTITITDATATNTGQSFVDFMRNRKNSSAWRTTGSNDAANTQIDINMGDTYSLDRILLILHNFSDYTIQYFNGTSYVDFSTPINVSGGTLTTTEHQFDSVSASLIRIIVTGAITADDDKLLTQLIVTSSVGQLNGYPQIKKPTFGKNKKRVTLLSGKTHIIRQVGSFSCDLEATLISDTDDLQLIENIYFTTDGVLMWINAGNSDQFNRENISYRPQDIFLVSPIDEYTPEFYQSFYKSGTVVKMKLEEVV